MERYFWTTVLHSLFCGGLLLGLLYADLQGMVFSGITRGGLGRSYTSYNHK